MKHLYPLFCVMNSSQSSTSLVARLAEWFGCGPHVWSDTHGFRPRLAASSHRAASGLCHCTHLLSETAYPGIRQASTSRRESWQSQSSGCHHLSMMSKGDPREIPVILAALDLHRASSERA